MPLLPESNKDMGFLLVLFFLIENLVGATGYLQRLRMLLYETVDVANTLLFQDLIDGDKNTSLLDITKTIIDSGTEKLHRFTFM